MGLISVDETISLSALTGGVSSLILLVNAGGRFICYKKALEKLNVAADWYAPVTRNRAEVLWMKTASEILPRITPEVLGEDASCNAFAMSYLDSTAFPVWKGELQRGSVVPEVAAAVGRALVKIHASAASRDDLPTRFSNSDQFHALRVEPYLLAAATKHPDLAAKLERIASITSRTRLTLVHGDVAPKNILVGGIQGIVFLDAECATYGDPAFDLAFCLNHLLLKVAALPQHMIGLQESASALVNTYRAGVDWEPLSAFDARLLALVPALMLARVDGKSPVEYFNEHQRAVTRDFARDALASPPASLQELRSLWSQKVT